jgi:hypothetical protein
MDAITDHLKQILKSLHEERRLIQAQLNAATDPFDIAVFQCKFIKVLACITDMDNKILSREINAGR